MALPPFCKAIGAIVLRTKVDPQATLWESLLPEEFRRLRLGFAPSTPSWTTRCSLNPSCPTSILPTAGPRPDRDVPAADAPALSLRLGFETLCGEVTDSLSWRRFCRIGPYDKVPDASTLMKITKRCGPDVVAQLNEALLKRRTPPTSSNSTRYGPIRQSSRPTWPTRPTRAC